MPFKSFLFLALLLICSTTAFAAVVQGYGVKSCSEFLATQSLANTDNIEAVVDEMRYRSWLTGLVSGLNMAANDDVLRGVSIDAALRRITLLCTEKSQLGFVDAAMKYLDQLHSLPIQSK